MKKIFFAKLALCVGLLILPILVVGQTKPPQNLAAPPEAAQPAIPKPKINGNTEGKAWIAAGCSDKAATKDWMQMRSYKTARQHLIWSASMGALSDGSETQDIRLRRNKITTDVYTPAIFNEIRACNLEPTKEIDNVFVPSKIKPGEQELRQIKAFQVLADIIVINKWEFELRFYKSENVLPKKNGLYGVVGEPFKAYKFKNPNPPETNRFQIIVITKDALPFVNEYYYEEATDTWWLYKNGKLDTKKPTVINPQNPCEMIMTRFTYEPNGSVTKRVEYFRAFPWGIELVKTIQNAGSQNPQTTSYTYHEEYDDPMWPGVKTITHPDGSITRN